MRLPISEVLWRGVGHSPANAMDHVLFAACSLAPRLCYGVELVLPAAVEEGVLRDALRRTVARFPLLGSRLAVGGRMADLAATLGARAADAGSVLGPRAADLALGLGSLLHRGARGLGMGMGLGFGLRWAPMGEDPVHRLLPPPLHLSAGAARSLRATLGRARQEALGRPLAPADGQCLRLHRFVLPTGQERLLLVAHPALCDLTAWLRVLEELFHQMAAVLKETSDLPVETRRTSRSLTGLVLEQSELSHRGALGDLASLLGRGERLRSSWEAQEPDQPVSHSVLRLAPMRLGRLKEEAALAGGVVRDALIACLSQALEGVELGLCRDRRGGEHLRVGLAVDLRRFARRRPGLGHYTGIQPLHLDLPLAGSLTAQVMQIRPQIERALEERVALKALLPATLLGQAPPAVGAALLHRALRGGPSHSCLVLDHGPLDRRLPSLLAADVRRVILYPPAAGFLPLTVAISSWRKQLTVSTASAAPHLAPGPLSELLERLSDRIHHLVT